MSALTYFLNLLPAWWLLVHILGIGCTGSIEFRVIDAQTSRPIEGVQVTRDSRYDDVIFGSRRDADVLSPTDANGLAKAGKLDKSMTH